MGTASSLSIASSPGSVNTNRRARSTPLRFAYEIRIGPGDVGRRVVVRWRADDGAPTDTLGILESCDAAAFGVRRKTGALIRIERERVLAAKVVPDAASPGSGAIPGS